MATVQLTLMTKPGCHLCDDAREVVESVQRALSDVAIEVRELNILEDPALARLYSEEIPVVQINGRRHAIWRVDPMKLEAAILRASKNK
ncbi:glutaredoxin family protein [Leucobacter insecticola]|uniref:Glutaredoxin family protein n=1 Tax=Leucobacter insecticola TaxID=2714934 RepID=A0A6G8FG08_9MICO|nr:glutaredoxin family protein [Leucobacter insecticola]QIM15380.1 glutaredoxin family protein [Leucobacter insecticola]